MTGHSSNVSTEGVDGLLDHNIAQAAALARLENVCWFAVETLIEADRIYRQWGPPPAPQPELDLLLAAVRHAISIAPRFGLEPERPETPTSAAVGEDPAEVGTNLAPLFAAAIDIEADDDIAHVFDDLKTTDDYDGGEAA